MGAASNDQDDIISGINVTPLVDVVLVLLIILMVTATAIVSKTIPMELPKASTGEETSRSLAISVDAQGALFLDAEPTDEEALRTTIRGAVEAGQDLRAVIAADGRLEHAKVVAIIDLLRQEKVTKFAINVRPN